MSRTDDIDPVMNQSGNEPFESVLEKRLSRRGVMKGSLGTAVTTMFSGAALTACSDDDDNDAGGDAPLALGFESVAASKTDAVVVAAGYTASVLVPWGEPLNAMAQEWKSDGSNTAEDQANAMGMHHDGMHYFPIDGSSSDGLLVINHEYIDQDALHPNGATMIDGARPAEEARKEINAHGVAVVRIQLDNGNWSMVKGDALNRRFTNATVMDLSGPVAGSDFVKTRFSPDGSVIRGTSNNCGNGYTPWGTYLACEENWHGYFKNAGTRTADQDRIGVPTGNGRYSWETAAAESDVDGEFSRFDLAPGPGAATDDYRNEANGYGYIVEIDPYDASTRAVKRTALGRFLHEGCWPGKLEAGQPVVFYSGHDGRGEYIYKFVSDAAWDPADAEPADRLATGAKYMDAGSLFVARFNEDGSGEWLPIALDTTIPGTEETLGDHYGSEAELIINTILAADRLGATPMDRPEWGAVNPLNGEVYMTLTNNSNRGTSGQEGVDAANPRAINQNGHIIRWREDGDLGQSVTFTWDIFVFGAAAQGSENLNVSGLTELNQFASPDGLWFDDRGVLWIQTDNGGNAVADATNDQVLAVVPGVVGDTGSVVIPGIHSDNQADLRRFFVGPNGCEVTGVAMTPDRTSIFFNIQHPGNWPSAADATVATAGNVRPRASTVVVRKLDGGEIGV